MGHSSVGDFPDFRSRLRTVRLDGTPVYGYQQRPGLPPVSVTRFDTEAAHAGLPPNHRHAHDFLVLIYVEEGTGSFTIDGASNARCAPARSTRCRPGRSSAPRPSPSSPAAARGRSRSHL